MVGDEQLAPQIVEGEEDSEEEEEPLNDKDDEDVFEKIKEILVDNQIIRHLASVRHKILGDKIKELKESFRAQEKINKKWQSMFGNQFQETQSLKRKVEELSRTPIIAPSEIELELEKEEEGPYNSYNCKSPPKSLHEFWPKKKKL